MTRTRRHDDVPEAWVGERRGRALLVRVVGVQQRGSGKGGPRIRSTGRGSRTFGEGEGVGHERDLA